MNIKLSYPILLTAKKLIAKGASRERVAWRLRRDMHSAVMKRPSLKKTLPYMQVSDEQAVEMLAYELRLVDPSCEESADWPAFFKRYHRQQYHRKLARDPARKAEIEKRRQERLAADPERAARLRERQRERQRKYYYTPKGQAKLQRRYQRMREKKRQARKAAQSET